MEEGHSRERVRRKIEFVEALGKGGFGAVYLANMRGRDNFAQRIAVKVLHADLGQNEDLVGRQRDEARLLGQLNHDHIVKVFDLLEIEGRPAVLMEYVPGVDAGKLLQRGPIPPRAALEIVAAAASGLDAAQTTISPFTGRSLAVIHRDVKPSNLLVSENGTVKILDFGIARADFEREGQTRSVQFGTARYMAPEQWLNESVTSAVDVFALGITAVELVSGARMDRLPLRKDLFAAGVTRTLDSIQNPRWGRIWWRELQDLLSAMLSYEPALRPGAEEVHERCTRLSEDVGGTSLRRYSKSHVPELISQQRQRMQDESLLPSAFLFSMVDPDPSIVTASKTMLLAENVNSARIPTALWSKRMWMSVGLLLAVGWYLSA